MKVAKAVRAWLHHRFSEQAYNERIDTEEGDRPYTFKRRRVRWF